LTAHLDAALRQRVFERAGQILPGILGHPISAVTDSTELMADLGLRSATTLQLLLELEDALEIEIDVEDIDARNVTTIGALADYIASHSTAA
jgi:acyl carrier protein